VLLVVTSCGASTASVTQRTPQVTPTAATATPTAVADPNGVSVQGTQLYHQGRAITLIGFNRTSLEYSCTGDDHLKLADFQAMRVWGANVVRLPTSSEFWANAGGACPTYRATVQRVVASARAAHLFVILDLQWSAPFDLPGDRTRGGVQCPMPDLMQAKTRPCGKISHDCIATIPASSLISTESHLASHDPPGSMGARSPRAATS
jgi:hypothetical protein